MKKIILLVLSAFLTGMNISFASDPLKDLSGIYGVSSDDPSNIRLQLNDDHTFSYTDYSDPGHKINVSGNWEMKKDKIFLKSSGTENDFHNKWKLTDDGMKIKSRKGLAFYSLCKL